MKKIILFFFLLSGFVSFSQDLSTFKLYHPDDNADKAIATAVKEAKETGKHVFVTIGGNWCIWCARFHDFITTDKKIDSTVQADYIEYHLNYSKENFNAEQLKKYGYPQRFGFPVFLIIDGNGKLIHTQNSDYLEEGKSYNKEKVMEFFLGWSPKALDPKQYPEKQK